MTRDIINKSRTYRRDSFFLTRPRVEIARSARGGNEISGLTMFLFINFSRRCVRFREWLWRAGCIARNNSSSLSGEFSSLNVIFES